MVVCHPLALHKHVEGQKKGKPLYLITEWPLEDTDKLPNMALQWRSGKNTAFGIEMGRGC